MRWNGDDIQTSESGREEQEARWEAQEWENRNAAH